MYVCQLSLECELDIELDEAQQAISMLLDQYRYNGQIIGREFPLTLVDDKFEITFVCPEQDSFAVK
jgi:predicted  nucleic acid-binding Zn ribbon protein